MNESIYLGVYWRARAESVERCALRTANTLQSLAACDPSLSGWHQQGATLEEALERQVPAQASVIQQVYLRQTQAEERLTGEGFSLDLWSGAPDESGPVLSLYCGDASPYVSNLCVITPPEQGPIADRLHRASSLVQILQTLIREWEPEWGLVTSTEWKELRPDSAKAGTFIGWLTYFSHRRGALPALPPPVHVEPVDGLGSLVLLTPERFSPSNPSHLQLARDTAARLEAAGLLHPLRPWHD